MIDQRLHALARGRGDMPDKQASERARSESYSLAPTD